MSNIIVPREAAIGMIESLKELDSRGQAMRAQFKTLAVGIESQIESLDNLRGAAESAIQSNKPHSESLARLRTLLESLL